MSCFKSQVTFEGEYVVGAISKWIPRDVIEYLDRDSDRRRKIVAMAQEVAAKLKIADWNIMLWDHEFVSIGILEILASSPECSTLEGRLQIARILAGVGIDGNVVQKYVAKFLKLEEPEKYMEYEKPEKFDTYEKSHAFLHHDEVDLRRALGRVGKDRIMDDFSSRINQPFHALCSEADIPFPNWSEDLLQEFRRETESVSEWIRRVEPILYYVDPGLVYGEEEHVELTQRTAEHLELSALSRFFENGEEDHLKLTQWTVERLELLAFSRFFEKRNQRLRYANKNIATYYTRMAFQVLSDILMQEYVSFICDYLKKKGRTIGKKTNFLLQRNKHVFNKRHSTEDKLVWDVFESTLANRYITNLCTAVDECQKVDIPKILSETLGAKVRQVMNIQVSILTQAFASRKVSRNTLLGKLSRGHVQLLQCGSDRVLIIPYLNKIILELRDERWVRDYDVKALQPCAVDMDYGSVVRRAANIVLGLVFPKEGEPLVSDTALSVLRHFARNGELFSMNLRDHLLGISVIEHRINILALISLARQVFGENKIAVAAFVREMIHDRLLIKSDINRDRISNENDAYYYTFYLKENYGMYNNIIWGQGVPACGMCILDSDVRTALLYGQKIMHGIKLKTSELSEEKEVWFPSSSHMKWPPDLPSGFIEDPEHENAVLLELNPRYAGNTRLSSSTGDFMIGGYCCFKIEADIQTGSFPGFEQLLPPPMAI